MTRAATAAMMPAALATARVQLGELGSRGLRHPIALLAIVVLVVNDHVLKAAVPGLVTGKLSDVAGMIFFPLLLAAAAEQFGLRRGQRGVVVATIATGVAFAAVKLVPAAAALYCTGLAALQWPFRALGSLIAGHSLPPLGSVHFVMDPTDLVALLALAIPLALARPTSD